PGSGSEQTLKKAGGAPPPLELVENPDILRELAAQRRPGQILTGFAAETENLAENGHAKLAAKGCDLLVVNQVGPGLAFGTSDNAALVLAADGTVTEVPRGPKEALAGVIWDLAVTRLSPPANATELAYLPELASRCPGRIRRTPAQQTSAQQGRISGGPSPLHLRISYGGPSGQDGRPDQRCHSRLDAQG